MLSTQVATRPVGLAAIFQPATSSRPPAAPPEGSRHCYACRPKASRRAPAEPPWRRAVLARNDDLPRARRPVRQIRCEAAKCRPRTHRLAQRTSWRQQRRTVQGRGAAQLIVGGRWSRSTISGRGGAGGGGAPAASASEIAASSAAAIQRGGNA
eukprot:scaffold163163_cov30-Tisochrysis_lutea.AAC.2